MTPTATRIAAAARAHLPYQFHGSRILRWFIEALAVAVAEELERRGCACNGQVTCNAHRVAS